jgi:formate dehydrogenase major subunit
MQLSRRGFIKIAAAGLAASSLGALGFGEAGEALAASVRPFKLTAATETRNTCTYCSVACGILIYSLGDKAKNAVSDITHIEGDPDHPVNRGTLCPKGSALETFVIDLGDLVFVGRSAGEPMRRRRLDRDAIDIGDRRLDRGDRVVGARV